MSLGLSKSRMASNLVLISFLYNFLISIDVNDIGFGADNIPILRYFSLILSVLVIFIIPNRFVLVKKDLHFRLIFLFFMLVLLGSLYSIIMLENSVDQSFLGRSLIILSFFSTYLFTKSISLSELERFAKSLIKMFIFFAVIYSLEITILNLMGGLKKDDTSKLIFHVNIPLVVSVAFLIFYYIKNSFIKYLLIILILIGSLQIVKNTTYITIFVTCFIWFLYKVANKRTRTRGLILFTSFIGAVLLSNLYIIQWSNNDFLPDGGTAVRYQTYLIRVNEFIESPLLGNYFTGETMIKIGSKINNITIPAHSDVLDILAAGGIVSMILLLIPVISASYRYSSKVSKNNSRYIQIILHFFLIVNVCWLFIMCFNPVLGRPRIAFFFWVGLGFIIGYKQRRDYKNG